MRKGARLFRNLPSGRAINFPSESEKCGGTRRQPRSWGVDLDNFRFGELFADYVRWNRVKNSRGPFSSRNKGKEGSLGGEGTKFPYVLYSYFHKIYTGIPVGQLLLCRRSLTWDKGLGSVLAAGDLDRSLENHRVFHENLYIRR